MNEVTDRNFGFLIAYLLPGFVGLLMFGPYSPTISLWMAASPTESPTVGGFLVRHALEEVRANPVLRAMVDGQREA